MEKIVVKKEELLDKVNKNLSIHKEEYGEAVENMKKEAQAYFKKQLSAIRKDQNYDKGHNFTVPQSHEDDYKQIIEMLNMTVDNEIELTYNEFQQYVMDRWDWSHSFKAATSFYNGS